jgi:hypothetical protein
MTVRRSTTIFMEVEMEWLKRKWFVVQVVAVMAWRFVADIFKGR